MNRINELYSVETNDWIANIFLANGVLWIRTGKQDLFRYQISQSELKLVDRAVTHFEASPELVVYVKDKSKVVVCSAVDLAVVNIRQFPGCIYTVHQVGFVNESISIASKEGIELWDYKTNRRKILRPGTNVVEDFSFFGSDLIVAAWDLLRIDVDTGETEVLGSREYDIDLPYYNLCNYSNKYLAISSSVLQIVDRDYIVVADSEDIPAAESIFVDESTLIVRVGGEQDESTEIDFQTIATCVSKPSFKVGIAFMASALASDPLTGLFAISRGNRVSIGEWIRDR